MHGLSIQPEDQAQQVVLMGRFVASKLR